MIDKTELYIDGAWVKSIDGTTIPVINPANEESYASITLAGKADTVSAIAAAKRAFPIWSMTSPGERLDYLKKLLQVYQAREREMAQTISEEMGAPIDLAISEAASLTNISQHVRYHVRLRGHISGHRLFARMVY